jgi:hypothetical protein
LFTAKISFLVYKSWILFLFFYVMILAVVFICYDDTRYSENIHHEQRHDSVTPTRPCLFEELWLQFGQPLKDVNSESCWSLDQMILRIPVDTILDQDHLVHLGSGRKGGVFKGTITWRNATNNQIVQCSVAIKTDQCYNGVLQMLVSKIPFFARDRPRGGGTTTSCLAPHAVNQIGGESFLAGEYTGALPFYAHRFINKQTTPLQGLLPTWGVVVKNKERRLSLSLSSLDRRVIGVVLPLQPFAYTLHDQDNLHQKPMLQNLTSFYQGMLEATKGLSFLHELGLIHQDVKAKNVGVLETLSTSSNATDSGTVVLYDNTFLRRDKDFSCPPHSRACQYCLEPAFFASPVRIQDLVNGSHSQVESDTLHLKAIVRNTVWLN